MIKIFKSLKNGFLYALILITSLLCMADSASATKNAILYVTPISGVAPVEVKLTCVVARNTIMPESYIMDFGDGSEPEMVTSNQYSHTFTHTYTHGFYKPEFTVQKLHGGTTISDPAKLIFAKWKFQTNGDIDSSPVIGPDGTIYVGSDDANLYAIHPETGEEIWQFKTGGAIRSSPSVSSDGAIYFGSLDRHLYAINIKGALRWSVNLGDYIFSSPAFSYDERILYVGSSDGNIYAINSSSGTIKWQYKTNNKIVSSPSVGHDGIGQVVYVGSLDKKLYALNAITGQLKWIFSAKSEIYGSPAIGSDGRIYFGECKTGSANEYDFNIYCLNVDGSKFWEFNGGTGFYSSPAIGSDGKIYVGSWDGYMYSINSNGTYSWSVRTSPPSDINSSPALGSNEMVFAGSKDGNFYAFQSPNVDEEQLRGDWVFETGDSIQYSSPVIDKNGTIYFGSRDNCVYAVNPGNSDEEVVSWSMFRGGENHPGYIENISIPAVISSFPANNSLEIDTDTTQIFVNFSPAFEADKINADSFKLVKITSSGNETVDGYASLDWQRYNNSGYHISAVFTRLDDKNPLEYNTKYVGSISYKSTGIDDEKAEKTFSWSFTTEIEPELDSGKGSGGSPGCFIHSVRFF